MATILLDYDGTLHETMHIYGPALRQVYGWLVSEGLAPERPLADREISRWLGVNSVEMWNTFLPELPERYKQEASRRVGAAMTECVHRGMARLYPGVEDALTALSARHRLVFLSNCKKAYLAVHREHFRLDRWFSGYFCCEAYDFIPKAEIFPFVAAEFDDCRLMIGDRASDLAVAARNGLRFLGCAYGYGEPEELQRADALAASPADLPALAEQLLD